MFKILQNLFNTKRNKKGHEILYRSHDLFYEVLKLDDYLTPRDFNVSISNCPTGKLLSF